MQQLYSRCPAGHMKTVPAEVASACIKKSRRAPTWGGYRHRMWASSSVPTFLPRHNLSGWLQWIWAECRIGKQAAHILLHYWAINKDIFTNWQQSITLQWIVYPQNRALLLPMHPASRHWPPANPSTGRRHLIYINGRPMCETSSVKDRTCIYDCSQALLCYLGVI